MKTVALNWKLNPKTKKEAVSLLGFSDRKGIIIFPPTIFLDGIAGKARRAAVGAQNVFWEEKGAFTGETSPSMIRDVGARFVLVGHSERRKYFGETDEIINKKIRVALGAGLKIVLCVGEPWKVRKNGVAAAKRFVGDQLAKDLSGIRNSKFKIRNLTVAYEPIWAIGTGRSDDPEESAAMASFIKRTLSPKSHPPNPKVLYGGSVDSKNVADFLKPREIDGVLIGGASVKKEELRKIFDAMSN